MRFLGNSKIMSFLGNSGLCRKLKCMSIQRLLTLQKEDTSSIKLNFLIKFILVICGLVFLWQFQPSQGGTAGMECQVVLTKAFLFHSLQLILPPGRDGKQGSQLCQLVSQFLSDATRGSCHPDNLATQFMF